MNGEMLETALTDYLGVRRALGFKLVRDELLLKQFVAFFERSGVDRITSKLAKAWINAPADASPSWLAMRLSVVRSFTTWLQASNPSTEVPPLGWLPQRRRTNPYLYSDDDISALMASARHARWPLSAATYEALIGLLAVTGLRVGEAIRLDRADVSLGDGLLTIRESKLGKSRQVPIHPTTVVALRGYLRQRSALSPVPDEPGFFVHPAGNRVTYESVQAMFLTFTRRAGLMPRSELCRPTFHGLRHTFAVNTLVRWYRAGEDVQAKLPLLSTWLGHADPKWTYWYLSASPELLLLASGRLETAESRRS